MVSAPLTRLSPPRAALLITGLAGLAAAALVLWITRTPSLAAGFVGAALVAGGAGLAWRSLSRVPVAANAPVDWNLARALAGSSRDAVAVTDRAGRLVCANDAYEALFAGFPTPPGLPLDGKGVADLGTAGRAAWRDGNAESAPLFANGMRLGATVSRAGNEADMLVWRFATAPEDDAVTGLAKALSGNLGDRLGSAGVMAALIEHDGRIRAANRALIARAFGDHATPPISTDIARALATDERGHIRFTRDGPAGTPLRLLQLPFAEGEGTPMLIALLDEEAVEMPAMDGDASAHVRSLIALLPLGLALVDRDGRFIQLNDAFLLAAQADPAAPPVYPGDLVVREDKGAVADAIRRFASGATHSVDLAIRLKAHPDEPVALTIAGALGLGDAAVLLSLKDNSEESRLKREVAQATKMQAVGQLAGGIAHDFNNLLTAIIGHCDLMLMRHSPGDSDYDDIQQIRHNSNRAASLTRQLLAFSRQQTLRPQVLQLPDVVAEVLNLLKRVIGETVKLEVSHGRNLGAIRADPGQLEQVVVNLAINARDAMELKYPRGGGTLTLQTRGVTATDVRRMKNDILPAADYTALIVRDTGTGIPPDALPKIFEPFFTTKETGKGTGLGLTTAYGIVKQSGGWIFADSVPGEGATFTIYLPVHDAPATPVTNARTPAAPAEAWGSGTVLLVEDEAMVRAVAERALARHGYAVLTAEHGEAALELLASNPRPDLLISDVVMPIMDGPTMVNRARELYPDLPVLFMSGYAEEQLRRSIDIEDVNFLAKPFSVQQLAAAARMALAR